MHSKMIAKQIIELNKAAFDNTFDAITIFQYHSEKMMMVLGERASFFPHESTRVITEWMETCRKGKEDFQKTVKDSFNTVESFLADSADATIFSAYALKRTADQSAKESTDSSPARAVVADNNLKQKTATKKKVDILHRCRRIGI